MKWISVKDKMPELLQDVLVIKDCDEPVYKIAHTDYNRFTNEITMWDVDGLDFYLPIDYFDCWMPLPNINYNATKEFIDKCKNILEKKTFGGDRRYYTDFTDKILNDIKRGFHLSPELPRVQQPSCEGCEQEPLQSKLTCYTCRYEEIEQHRKPCNTCNDFSNYQPKEK